MAVLQKFHPDAYDTLKRCNDPLDDCLKELPHEMLGFSVQDSSGRSVPIHEDPAQEITDYLEPVPTDRPSVVVLIGFGLGYIAEALLKERDSIRHLIVFEHFTSIFSQALQTRDLTSTLSDPRLILGMGPDIDIEKTITPAAKSLQLEHIHILRHLPSFHLDMDGYKKLHDSVYEEVNNYNICGSTIMKMGKRFIKNRFDNLSSIGHNRLIDSLKGIFTGTPAILVASGPSLDQNVHLLKRAKDMAVIIAIDSALPSLLAHGIKPDFITALDPDDVVYEKIASCAPQASGVNLICQLGVTPKTPKIFPADEIFWAFNNNPQSLWINKALGGQISVGETHSNAHLNLVSAIIMGASPIVFVGQDLAFTSQKSHGDHVVLKEHDIWKKRLEDQDDTIWTEDIHGRQIATHRGFFAAKLLFEQIMASQKNHYINATAAGVHLEGTETMDLEEAIDRFCHKDVGMGQKLRAAEENSSKPTTERLTREVMACREKANTILRKVEKAGELLTDTIPELQTLHKDSARYTLLNHLPASLYNRIAEIDALNLQIDSEHSIWHLLVEYTLEGLKKSERLQHEINLLANRPEKFLQWLDKNFARLSALNSMQKEALTRLMEHLDQLCAHYDKEKKLLKKIVSTDRPAPQTVGGLAQLYYQSGDFVRLSSLIDLLHDQQDLQGEYSFYKGCLAALWNNHTEADEFFRKTIEINPLEEKRIKKFRERQAEEYTIHAETYDEIDRPTSRMLLLKALQFSPEDDGARAKLVTMLEDDIASCKKLPPQEAAGLLSAWHEDCAAYSVLLRILPPEHLAEMHMLYGQHLASQGRVQDALALFKKAQGYSDAPKIHIALTESYFHLADFHVGIQHLKTAVEKEPSYARYWENIGDILQQSDLYQDAITAYEQGFTAQPANGALLKKIGDCYRTLGQYEAAREAYLHFKSRHINKGCSAI